MGTYIRGLMALIGTAIALYSSWYLVRGPFFGGPLPETEMIPVAVAGFICGIIALAWGASGIVIDRAGRPDLESAHSHTNQEFFDR